MLPTRTFLIPPVLITGSGSLKNAGDEIKKIGVKKGLLMTDKIMSESELFEGVKKALSDSGIEFVVYNGITTEPTVDFVNEGLKAYNENTCEFIVAFGGGSAIDTAKAVAVMVTNNGSIENYMGLGKIPRKGVPLVAIPTTAGTGSEVTIFTIITDTRTDVKMLLGSPFLLPQVSIVDPLLTLSCPPGLTAAVGIDAFTHAVEAYVSVKAQPMSDIFCLSAVSLISGSLRQAWSDGNDLDAREKTMMGALQAGIAFSNASVALVHGMSRPIGAYFHVPHGVSNAALLGTVTEFSLPGNPARYGHIAKAMGEDVMGLSDVESAELASRAINRLIKDVKIPSLKELGIEKEKLDQLAPAMADAAIASGSPGNNPRRATKEEIIELYKIAYERS